VVFSRGAGGNMQMAPQRGVIAPQRHPWLTNLFAEATIASRFAGESSLWVHQPEPK